MTSILFFVFGKVANWAFSAGSIKWGLLAALWYGATILVGTLTALLPDWFNASKLSESFNFFNSGMWYFWNYFKGSEGLAILLGASVARFLIRRIPFIG